MAHCAPELTLESIDIANEAALVSAVQKLCTSSSLSSLSELSVFLRRLSLLWPLYFPLVRAGRDDCLRAFVLCAALRDAPAPSLWFHPLHPHVAMLDFARLQRRAGVGGLSEALREDPDAALPLLACAVHAHRHELEVPNLPERLRRGVGHVQKERERVVRVRVTSLDLLEPSDLLHRGQRTDVPRIPPHKDTSVILRAHH